MLTVCTEQECLTCAHVRSRVHTDTHVRGCAHAHNSQKYVRKDQPPEWGANTQVHTIAHALSNTHHCTQINAGVHVYAPLLTHTNAHTPTKMRTRTLTLHALRTRAGAAVAVFHQVAMLEEDVKLIPKGKLVVFTEPADEAPSYDHCMPFYRPETYFAPVFDWIAQHTST